MKRTIEHNLAGENVEGPCIIDGAGVIGEDIYGCGYRCPIRLYPSQVEYGAALEADGVYRRHYEGPCWACQQHPEMIHHAAVRAITLARLRADLNVPALRESARRELRRMGEETGGA